MRTVLREWAEREGHGAIRRLSEEASIPYRTLHRFITGEREPSLQQALAIQTATAGEVRVEDLAFTRSTNAPHSRAEQEISEEDDDTEERVA